MARPDLGLFSQPLCVVCGFRAITAEPAVPKPAGPPRPQCTLQRGSGKVELAVHGAWPLVRFELTLKCWKPVVHMCGSTCTHGDDDTRGTGR